jgi:transposase-like protein
MWVACLVRSVLGMSIRDEGFVPPHCPRTRCAYHRCATGWRWVRHGTYTRQCEPRIIPRYRCGHCRATFSSQTFSTTYYLKRPELLEPLFHRTLACSAYRQIAREARCAHSTLMRQAARLGRHGLLLLAEAMQEEPLTKIRESVVIDGFESFAFSQYHPLHLHLSVGASSHFTYAFTHSRLRRKGRMTARQRQRRRAIEAEHGRPDPGAIEHDMAAALRLSAPRPQALVVLSDEHPAYPRALRHLPGHAITHRCTPSVQARTVNNPLFPVNRMDLLLRHNSANHKRQTIAFSKRHQGVIDRAAVLVAWCNFAKPVSENHDPDTPAMKLGLQRCPLSPAAMLARRRFPSRIELSQPWREYYYGSVDTPGIANPRRHTLKRAV